MVPARRCRHIALKSGKTRRAMGLNAGQNFEQLANTKPNIPPSRWRDASREGRLRVRGFRAMKMHVLPFALDPLPDASFFERARDRAACAVDLLD
jgi:hypothetical protein